MEKTEHQGRFKNHSFARQVAFQLLYQEDLNPGTGADLNDDFIFAELQGLCRKKKDDQGTAKEEIGQPIQPVNEDITTDSPVSHRDFNGLIHFVKDLVNGTLKYRNEIDQMIGNLAENWSVSRMAKTDRNILRLAVFEMIHKKTPKAIVIHEALNLGSRFGTENSSAFMNGILDKVDPSADLNNLKDE